ncbi:sensor histidine kinase [Chromatocurvus halotolerans]|uniref:histidine kinase n=1 Tax=Chromatocurvus halotolerans TaxID=1132028 RepID=A0A4R2KGA7_9GAMM|nr:sensor histidine kinase [Chromatocurvus halotolerans]TCO72633.1 two-component system sensor histidine kinase TctE [Chromatocurvus halotolerans]
MGRSLSLKTLLLLLVAGPLLLLMLVESAVSYLISMQSTKLLFDRWLLNSVHSMSKEVHVERDRLQFTADRSFLEVFEWDELDEVYFQVATPDGEIIAGTEELALPPPGTLESGPLFRDLRLDGKNVRAVSLFTQADNGLAAVVTIAETLVRRQTMTADLLRDVLISKALLLVAVLLLIATAFDRGLNPLIRLGRAIGQRSPRDLTLIDVGQVPTEVRGLVENSNQLLSRIDTAISAREQFIGNIAHQIRTPLAGMKLQAQLAQDETDPEKVQVALLQISHAADHMAHVNSQLMKLARAEAAFGRGLRTERVDLNEVVEHCCADNAQLAHERGIHLVMRLPEQKLFLDGEFTLLAEMVRNLVENAVKYGSENGHVWVELTETLDGISLVVEDDGPGISQDDWPQIFDRFFRPVDSSGDGCGLGLAIVREIALAHGASVQIQDRMVGSGARFVVHFN